MLTKERDGKVESALKEIEKELASLNLKKTTSIFELESDGFENCGKCGKACCDYRS